MCIVPRSRISFIVTHILISISGTFAASPTDMGGGSRVDLVVKSLPSVLPHYIRSLVPRSGLKKGASIPPIVATWRGASFDPASVKAYSELCGVGEVAHGEVPLLYPHSFLGPLHLQMVTHAAMPLSMVGSVHSRNHVLQNRPLRVSDAFDVTLRMGGGRHKKQGYEFDLATDIVVGGELVWTSVSAFLVRSSKGDRIDADSVLAASIRAMEGEGRTVGSFPIPASTGRAFGALTRDINPIHMSAAAARLFGFERDLVHGMWGLARALPLLAPSVDARAPVRLDVAFKGPMYMEREVAVRVAAERAQAAAAFEMYSASNPRPVVVGRIANVAAVVRPLSTLDAPPASSKL
jgi:acyl dehydratase